MGIINSAATYNQTILQPLASVVILQDSGIDNDPLYWFAGILIAILLMAYLIRTAIYSYVVSEKRSIPDRATRLGNMVAISFIIVGIIVTAVKLYLIYR